ncbi:MAG: low molecular weight phosphotyrosine protein phosphatase [Candidatus Ancillula sp.]|jgi:protein-tyrosine phosphatase|nr:low molecular weight phosphotyrosine protein phosphatase [Candidatus Ancillula sp.]
MTIRITPVCTGNICRSAMAEVVLSQIAEDKGYLEKYDFDFSSRGVSDEEEGNPLDFRARTVLRNHNYTNRLSQSIIRNHQAHQITRNEVENADLLLAMTKNHAKSLIRRFDADPNKVIIWRWFEKMEEDKELDSLDLADPWYGGPSDFEKALSQIERSASKVIEYSIKRFAS